MTQEEINNLERRMATLRQDMEMRMDNPEWDCPADERTLREVLYLMALKDPKGMLKQWEEEGARPLYLEAWGRTLQMGIAYYGFLWDEETGEELYTWEAQEKAKEDLLNELYTIEPSYLPYSDEVTEEQPLSEAKLDEIYDAVLNLVWPQPEEEEEDEEDEETTEA